MTLPAAGRLAAALLVVTTAACRDSNAPGPLTAAEMAARFDRIGDSYDRQGDAESGASMHGVAMMVRTSGRLSTADLTIDGARSAGWYLLGVQQKVPAVPCPAGAPDWCVDIPPQASRVVLGWHGTSADRLLVLVSDTSGTGNFAFDFESADPFDRLATAIYLDRSGQEAWLSDSGTVTTAYQRTGGSCPSDAAASRGVQYTCERANFDVTTAFRAYEFSMFGAEPTYHRVSVAATGIAGVLMNITDWGSMGMMGRIWGMPGGSPMRARAGAPLVR